MSGSTELKQAASEYKDVGGGVKFPFRTHVHMGDHPLIPGGHNYQDLRGSDVKNVATPPKRFLMPYATLRSQRQIGWWQRHWPRGVVLARGGSHNSVAVEFKDYVVMIEGPLSNSAPTPWLLKPRRCSPTSRSAIWSTPTTTSTMGGVRGYDAEGATVITDDRNRTSMSGSSWRRNRGP